jgi:hypothetical protein
MRRGELIMSVPLNSFQPAAIHQKDMRNSDRLLIFSHLIDRYIETRTKIIMKINEEGGEQIPE